MIEKIVVPAGKTLSCIRQCGQEAHKGPLCTRCWLLGDTKMFSFRFMAKRFARRLQKTKLEVLFWHREYEMFPYTVWWLPSETKVIEVG